MFNPPEAVLQTESGAILSEQAHELYQNPRARVLERAEIILEHLQESLSIRNEVAAIILFELGTGSRPDRLYCNQSAKGDGIAYLRMLESAKQERGTTKGLNRFIPSLETDVEKMISRRDALIQLGVGYYYEQMGDLDEAGFHYGKFENWLNKNGRKLLKELKDKNTGLQDAFKEFDNTMVWYGKKGLSDLERLLHSPTFTVKEAFKTLGEVTYFLENVMLAEIEKSQPGVIKNILASRRP